MNSRHFLLSCNPFWQSCNFLDTIGPSRSVCTSTKSIQVQDVSSVLVVCMYNSSTIYRWFWKFCQLHILWKVKLKVVKQPVFSLLKLCVPQPMASFLNSDDEDYDLLNNQNNNLFENRVLFENQTQTTLLNYYDATIKTVCYFLSLLKTASNVLDFSKYLEFCIF